MNTKGPSKGKTKLINSSAEFSTRDSRSTPSIHKNPAAVYLGRLGGLKGGPARAKVLSKRQRVSIAKKAAFSRWNKT